MSVSYLSRDSTSLILALLEPFYAPFSVYGRTWQGRRHGGSTTVVTRVARLDAALLHGALERTHSYAHRSGMFHSPRLSYHIPVIPMVYTFGLLTPTASAGFGRNSVI